MQMGAPPRVRWGRIALLLALWAGAMLLYAGTLSNPPVWDDHNVLFGQGFLMDCRNLPTAANPANFFRVLPVRNAARPAWLVSALLDTCLGGGRVVVYRIDNIFWHAVGAMLVMALGWCLSRDLAASLLAGVLFAVHPVHTETVNIISFRGDLLALASMLLSLILYREGDRRSGWTRWACWAASLAGFFTALLAKEMAIVLPLLLLLEGLFFPPTCPQAVVPGGVWQRRALLGGFALLVPFYLVFHTLRSGYVMAGHQDILSRWGARTAGPAPWPQRMALASRDGMSTKLEDPPWHPVYADGRLRFLTMSRVFGSYLRLLAWPWPLQGDYSPPVLDSWRHAGLLASWVAWLLLFAAAWKLRHRLPMAGFGLMWTATALLPVSGIVILRNLQAERYLYVPSAGFCLALGAVLARAGRLGPWRRRVFGAATALLILFWAGLTLSRNRDYRSELSYFRATEMADGSVARVHLALAGVYEGLRQPAAAEAEFRAALRLWPRYRKAQLLFAGFLMDKGRAQESEALLRSAGALSPGDPVIALRLGVCLLEQGHAEQAMEPLRAALEETNWASPLALYHLALACRRSGRLPEAGRLEERLRLTSPDLADLFRSRNPRIIRPAFF